MNANVFIPDQNIRSAINEGLRWCDYWGIATSARPLFDDETWPLERGVIVFEPSEGDDFESEELNYMAIVNGLESMALGSPDHFGNMFDEGMIDCETGDVFLQYCLFGEVIYG